MKTRPYPYLITRENVMAHDWTKDVKRYVANPDEAAIKGIVRYCGIALQSRLDIPGLILRSSGAVQDQQNRRPCREIDLSPYGMGKLQPRRLADRFEDGAQAGADYLVVVGDEDARHGDCRKFSVDDPRLPDIGT